MKAIIRFLSTVGSFFVILAIAPISATLGGCSNTDGGGGSSSGFADTRSEAEAALVGYWIYDDGNETFVYHFTSNEIAAYTGDSSGSVLTADPNTTGAYEVIDGLGGESRDDVWGVRWNFGGSDTTSAFLFQVEPGRVLSLSSSESGPFDFQATDLDEVHDLGFALVE